MRLSRSGTQHDWRIVFSSAEEGFELNGGRTVTMPVQSIALLVAD